MNPVSSLSQADELALANWLQSNETPDNTFSLMAVKGFFFALVCAPEPVEASDWIATLFAGDVPADLASDKVFALSALYNQISDEVYEFGPKLPQTVELSSQFDANFLAGHPLHEWSLGFSQGIRFYGPSLLEALSPEEELTQAFSMAITTLSFFADKAHLDAFVAEQENTDVGELSNQLFELMPDFITGFADLVEHVALATGLYGEDEDGMWEE